MRMDFRDCKKCGKKFRKNQISCPHCKTVCLRTFFKTFFAAIVCVGIIIYFQESNEETPTENKVAKPAYDEANPLRVES